MRFRSTFVEVLQSHAAHRPARRAYTFLQGDVETGVLTYEALDIRARAIAAMLQGERLGGRRVLLLYAPGLQFIEAFLGCLYAGAIAVPVYPPEPGLLKRSLPRFRTIIQDAQVDAALTVDAIQDLFHAATPSPDLQRLKWLTSDNVDDFLATMWTWPGIGGDSLAFLQYTSGSTSTPKGVMVTHRNILNNEAVIQDAFGHTAETVISGWLPFYHDMGLIGNIIQPAYLGSSCYLMSPMEFLRRPLSWLRTIGRYHAETSGGPNFAYDLCVRKLASSGPVDLDLSSWRVAFNGSEPIRPATLRRFADAFAPYGFDARAFYPCYGLAESTLFVTGARRGEGAAIRAFDIDALEHATAVATDSGRQRELVGCGSTFRDQQCVIVDPETRVPADHGHVGEIWVSGPSVVSGYWGRPEDTAETFGATIANDDSRKYLRTGDLGFVHGGELFVTGRRKDLIIVRGRNHYPHDIEETTQQAYPGLRAGCCAAFSVEDGGEEQLVVVQEVTGSFDGNVDAAASAIRRAIAETHELQTRAVVLLKHGELQKTSSGKIQRRACRARYLAGTLEIVGLHVQEHSAVEVDGELPSLEDLSTLPTQDRRTRVRQFVVALAGRALGIPRVSVQEARPLGEQGLDSLRAIEIKHELDSRFGGDLSIADLLNGASIAQLAEQFSGSAFSRTIPVETSSLSPRDEFALSYGQRALWYLHQLDPEGAAYNISVAVRMSPSPDVTALQSAFTILLDRHRVLRTVYVAPDGVPFQRILQPAVFAMEIRDALRLDDAALATAVESDAHRPFDLEQGPVFRATLFLRHAEAVLLLSVHHIAADFWSLETIAGELRHLYEACATGRPGSLPPVASDYEAYVAWQAAYLESEKGAKDIRYWASELSDPPAILAIPTDKPRSASPSSRGRSVPFVVPAGVAAGLRALADREGVTVFTLLLAAYQVLLSRYSMQDDVLVGTPVAGRSRKPFAPLVGYFVNSVVLRGRLGENPAFVAYLRQTRRAVAAALEHQDAPFPLIVERLKPHRDSGRSPFFQAMFSLQQPRDERASALAGIALGVPGGSLAWDTLTLEGYPLQRRVAQFDLSLEMASAGSALLGSLEYAEDLFHAETAARMVEQFGVLLAGIVANPAARVKSLSLVSPDEARLQLDVWNRTERPYRPAETVVDLWLKQVVDRPDAVALVDGEVEVTYRELHARAGVVARRLSAAGVGLDSRVVILLPRSADMIAAVLAVLTTGAAYVPIDPGTPVRRISFMVGNCAAAAIVTSAPLKNRLASVDCAICDVDECEAPTTATEPVIRTAGRENAAYVIYTSGTSGRPKGVVVEHRSLLHYVQVATEAFAIRPGDRVLQFASLAFDASVEEIFTTLAAGGTLVLRDDAMLESAATFLGRCGDLGITVLDLPTAYWSELVASATSDDWQQAEALRLVILGGEKVTVERLRRWHDAVGQRVELLNTYGPTEATVAATVANLTHFEPADLAEMTEVSIGRPFPNCRAYVLDDELEPLPIGAPGELCLGGEGIAAGYLDAPELTASRFLADPFVSTPGARIYRTGDKARFLADGSLQYLGRLDQQVKIRGYRVELGEIEAALGEYPGVRHAAVRLDGVEAGERRLIGYVDADPGAPPSAAGLRAFLKERLPQYMVPSVLVAVAAMPMSAAGKIDRQRLPAPSAANRLRDESGVPEGNALEARMAAVWKRVLKIDHVGVHDNFFDVGGHSLLLPVLLNEIRKEFDRTVTMVALLERPTVAASAALFGELDRPEDHAVQRGRARASRMREMTARQRRTTSSEAHHDSLSA